MATKSYIVGDLTYNSKNVDYYFPTSDVNTWVSKNIPEYSTITKVTITGGFKKSALSNSGLIRIYGGSEELFYEPGVVTSTRTYQLNFELKKYVATSGANAGQLTADIEIWLAGPLREVTWYIYDLAINFEYTEHTHSYGSPTYTWSSDGKSCTAKRTCSVCGGSETSTATITSAVKTAATCTTKGTTTYTAKFSASWATTQTKDVQDIAQKSHSYTGAIKSDGNGKDATHSFKCVNGCNQYGGAVKHTWNSGTVTKQPTCTATGVKTYTCTASGCGATYTEEIAKKAHTEVTIPAVAPTCTATGLTEGKKCSVCGTIITAQQTVAALGHSWNAPTYTWSADGKSCTAQRVCKTDANHKETATATITSAVKTAATCTTKGTTTYTAKFSVSWASTQTKDVQDIAAKGHTSGTAVIENRIEATCTTAGSYDEVVYCTVCGAELSRNKKTIPAKGHTEVIDKAVEPTCTTSGKTEGKHCSVCNVIIVAQQTIPTIDHSYTSSTSGGYIVYICDHCGHSYSERALIPIKANLEQVTGVYVVPDANDPETGTIVYVMNGTVPTVETVFHTVDGWHFLVSNTIPDNSYPLEKLFVTDNKGNTTRIW